MKLARMQNQKGADKASEQNGITSGINREWYQLFIILFFFFFSFWLSHFPPSPFRPQSVAAAVIHRYNSTSFTLFNTPSPLPQSHIGNARQATSFWKIIFNIWIWSHLRCRFCSSGWYMVRVILPNTPLFFLPCIYLCRTHYLTSILLASSASFPIIPHIFCCPHCTTSL